MDPFAILVDIAHRSKTNSSGLPAQAETVSYWRGVGFMLSGQRFLAPLGEISEILRVPKFTRLPGVKPWVQGVSNVRGRLLPIIDLPGFLGERPGMSSKSRRVLVIENGDMFNGVVVDGVLGMQYFPADTYSDDSVDTLDTMAPFIQGSYQKDGVAWAVISLYNLTGSEAFMHVAI